MSEPVAYRAKDEDEMAYCLTNEYPDGRWDIIQPLYTTEQLHPRVKMTQAEFDEFNKLLLSSAVTIYEVIDTIYKDNGKMNDFPHLYQRLFNRNDKLELENQLEFSKLWADFNPDNPEEMIEIVPDMKWFVRSKVSDDGYYSYLFKHSNRPIADYEPSKQPRKEYMTFDTKEEAEKWTNPLTEAVQLPVEDE